MLMLNEIRGVLTEQLPEHQMDDLTDDELAWIAEKADMTRDRCYILVNMYMQ